MQANKNFFLKTASFVVVILFWEYAGRTGYSSALPAFTETMSALIELTLDGSLAAAFAKTLYPLAIGLLVSISIGVALGIFMGLKDAGEWLFAPIFIVAQAAPLAALIPVLTFAYGIGITAKVFTVCIMAMPVIVLNTLGAVRNTPGSLIEMAKSFQATRLQVVLNIILPAASPLIFVGLRLGCASGFIGIILAELLITPTGIGDIISYNQSVAEYGKMYAAILSIIVSSVLFIELLEKTEKWMFSPDKRT
jgi:NitT/TauT family transport system permease protein